jgi:hypothetical protein
MANVIERLTSVGPFPILASAARTVTPDTKEFEAAGVRYSGLYVVIDVTAVTLTPSVTVKISGVDRISGKLFDILTSAAITATGTTTLHVGPGITAAANTQEDQHVPPIFRITSTHGDADSITYSIAGMLCP